MLKSLRAKYNPKFKSQWKQETKGTKTEYLKIRKYNSKFSE